MNLTPKNRYIRIEELTTIAPEKKGFILPDNYEPPPEEYDYFRVISQAEDCTLALKNGDTIAVERHMVKNLVFHKEKYLLVLENYVLASLADG
jgi:co-chaperonin GroES (HSP10)|tara:strand:+ start:850 stop:1128 length:279 start_codon:yes stop_codon:yes gene_type:complete